MTLGLVLLTPEMVLLVTDMLLTERGTGRELERNARKALFFRGESLFTFAGAACIRGQPTDEWILDAIKGARSPTEAATSIARGADRDLPAGDALIVVGGGWGRRTPGGITVPLIVRVSNERTADPAFRAGRFAVQHRLLPAEPFPVLPWWIESAGQPVPEPLQRAAGNLLNERLARDDRWELAIDVLAIVIQEVASLPNPTVGRNMLFASLPRGVRRSSTRGHTFDVMIGPPNGRTRTVAYRPDGHEGPYVPAVQYLAGWVDDRGQLGERVVIHEADAPVPPAWDC